MMKSCIFRNAKTVRKHYTYVLSEYNNNGKNFYFEPLNKCVRSLKEAKEMWNGYQIAFGDFFDNDDFDTLIDEFNFVPLDEHIAFINSYISENYDRV